MKIIIMGLAFCCIFLFSCNEVISYITNEASPCMCWKHSEWMKYQNECDNAANKMSIDDWDKKVEACKDYRLKEDKSSGYTKKELVAINSTWTEVFVKE